VVRFNGRKEPGNAPVQMRDGVGGLPDQSIREHQLNAAVALACA